ncbi:MAG: Piwi domain-containing protein [Chitinophagales bacterium]
MNKIKIDYIPEPKIEFGDDILCDDPKMGLQLGGFFSTNENSHKSEIHLGIIGTKQNVQDFQDWIGRFSQKIEAKVIENIIEQTVEISDGVIEELHEDNNLTSTLNLGTLFENSSDGLPKHSIEEHEQRTQNKKFNPDFPGYTSDGVFKSKFLVDSSNIQYFKGKDITELITNKKNTNINKLEEAIAIIEEAYNRILEYKITDIDVCIIIIPDAVYDKLNSVSFGKSHINFRRKLKALLISKQNSIPVQIVLESTIKGTKKSMQDLSMQAWNFVVANYYKSGCIPWTLNLQEKDSCFIGISFHKLINGENNLMRASVAQAFNYEGKGIVFIGKPFEWNSKKTKTSAPHLEHNYAYNMIKNVIDTYIKINNNKKPNRIVIHKTTDFWTSNDNQEYAEVEGLEYGIKELLGDDIEIDFVTITNSKIRLYRQVGIYPVPRGTLLEIDDKEGVLYTTGYIPYYELYPGMATPRPLHIKVIGESTLRQISTEILALSKMNFNNCNYYDSLPITIRFAQRVGEIVQYFPDGVIPPNKYYYYM